MRTEQIRRRLAECRERIDAARERSGHEQPVGLVAITKTHPRELLEAAREAGIEDVGENRVGELEQKVEALGREAFRWHLVGHLQRNKAVRALDRFDLLHSLDSLRLARTLSAEAAGSEAPVRVLVQVNTSGEASKYGLDPEQALKVLEQICALPGLAVEGLMTMAPYTDDEAVLRRTFRGARALWERAGAQVEGFRPLHLSMGMSNDYEIAVEEGSTLVRLGTALFGERPR
jgi:pyridoxal phosphate enzyme (YggS family)